MSEHSIERNIVIIGIFATSLVFYTASNVLNMKEAG